MNLTDAMQHLVERAQDDVLRYGFALPRAAIFTNAGPLFMQLGVSERPTDPVLRSAWLALQLDSRMRILGAVAALDPPDGRPIVVTFMAETKGKGFAAVVRAVQLQGDDHRELGHIVLPLSLPDHGHPRLLGPTVHRINN